MQQVQKLTVQVFISYCPPVICRPVMVFLFVQEDTPNHGHLIRRPVSYEASKEDKRPSLDPNHSHFILVVSTPRNPLSCMYRYTDNSLNFLQQDDGSIGQFGKEIELRGQFEGCTCLPKGCDDEQRVARVLREMGLGWEGAHPGWESISAKGSLGRVSDRSLSVCLCFEGGPGTVDTVFAAAANRTPVMLVRGSGRAADLLADCVRVHERGRSMGIDDDDDDDDGDTFEGDEASIPGSAPGSSVELDDASEDGEEEEAVERTRCVVSGFLACLRQLRDLALRRSTGADWPPRLPPGFRMGGDDEPWGASPGDGSEEAEEELLRRAIRAGRAVFREYGVDFPSASDDDDKNGARAGRALVLSSRLYDCVRSRLCVVFDLAAHSAAGAAVASGGRPVAGSPWNGCVRTHLVECLIRRVACDAEARAAALVLKQWRQFYKREEDGGGSAGVSRSASVQPQAQGAAALLMSGRAIFPSSPAIASPRAGVDSTAELPSALTLINGDARRGRLRLLIEFGQTRAARDLLGRLAGKGILNDDRGLLGDVLHVALRFGSREAVGEILRRGADLDLYARRAGAAVPSTQLCSGSAVPGMSLCDLLVAAGRREKTSYVRDLLRASVRQEASLLGAGSTHLGYGGADGDSTADLENLADDRQARRALDRIYLMIMAGEAGTAC